MTTLDQPLVKAVGAKAAKRLAALELETAGDLLRHYPRRYAQRGELTDLAGLADGEYVTVLAEVEKVQGRKIAKRPGYILEVTVTDGNGRLVLTFFGTGARVPERELPPGTRGLFAGKVSFYRTGQGVKRQLVHPEYRPIRGEGGADGLDGQDGQEAAREFAEELIPVYPATKGLTSWQIADCVRVALETTDPDRLKGMPGELITAYQRLLRAHGVDIMSSTGGVTSSAHTDEDLDLATSAFKQTVHALRDAGLIHTLS